MGLHSCWGVLQTCHFFLRQDSWETCLLLYVESSKTSLAADSVSCGRTWSPCKTKDIPAFHLHIASRHGGHNSFQCGQGTLPASLMRHQPPGTGHRSACATNHSSKSDTELPSLGNQKWRWSQKFKQSRQVHRTNKIFLTPKQFFVVKWSHWDFYQFLMESAIRYTVILRRKAKISICPKMEHSFLSATFVWETGPNRSRWMDWGSSGKGVFKAWHLSCANPWRQFSVKVLGKSHGWKIFKLGRLLDFFSYKHDIELYSNYNIQ